MTDQKADVAGYLAIISGCMSGVTSYWIYITNGGTITQQPETLQYLPFLLAGLLFIFIGFYGLWPVSRFENNTSESN
jgi:hypothetical protein